MRVRDLDSWPPAITDSKALKVSPSPAVPAKFKRCGVYTIAGSAQPYLSIVVEHEGRDWHAMISDQPEALLRRIEATLQGHEGMPLADLGDLEVVEIP
jgi:hypothetical protein